MASSELLLLPLPLLPAFHSWRAAWRLDVRAPFPPFSHSCIQV
jgi:hypothetical protein